MRLRSMGFAAGLMLFSAVAAGAAERAATPAPPSLEEQLAGVPRGSALAALVAANQDFSLLDAREFHDDVALPLWLRVHWRRAHPETAYSPSDPSGGYPLTLRRALQWMLANPDLVAGPAPADGLADDASSSPPLAASNDADLLAASVSGEMRISGLQTSPRSTSDIRVDFWNPSRIVAAANNISLSGVQAQLYSSDGGASWSQTSLPLAAGDAFHSGPTVDWTSNGIAWSVTTGVDAGVTNLRLRAYQSFDGGATWSFDATASGAHAAVDKPMLWVDHSATSPFADNVYVCWRHNLAGYVNRRSGGAWQLPIQTTGAETQGSPVGCDVKTNTSGDLFNFWPAAANRKIVVAKSTDGGASFSAGTVIATTFDGLDIGVPAYNGGRRPLIYVSGGAYRTDAKNLVYASWMDLTGAAGCTGAANAPGSNTASTCKTRIWFSRSTNGGTTWSAPVMINNQGSLNDQFNQALTVDETTGALGIVYYDTVGDAARTRADLWYQSSFDDGATWSTAVKVTSAMTDETVAGADNANQYGDYNGLSGQAGVFFPSWTDRRNNLREEIWTARVTDFVCTPPGAPAIGTATATAPNQIQVTWGNGAPPATTFNVYRKQGNCAAPVPFTRIASGVASPYNDNTVSGSLTYAYQVTGLDSPACSVESAPSGCVQATATGGCMLPPTFAGLAGVGSAAAATCGVTLSWAAATPGCAAPVVYDVYRSTNPGFTPGPGNLIASGVGGTSYTDSVLLTSGTIYYYVVRAFDSVSGVGESNLVRRAATPTGPLTTIVETFEGAQSGGGFDNAGWTHAAIAGATDWAWSAAQSQTPTHSWFSDSVPGPAPSDRQLASPAFVPQATSTVSFWHTFAFEGTLAECYDAGTLETTINAGTSWATFPGAAFTAGGFNGSANAGFGNPIGGRPAWCAGTVGAMTQVTANLASLPRVDTRLRWHAGDDDSNEATGWFVDSVTISNVGIVGSCTIGGNVIFADGFESGTLGAWTGGFTPP